MFLSLRAALERWPRQLRFFALALALLAWVAPTWHVCELGGHVMSCASGQSGHHNTEQATVSKIEKGRNSLICYCAPRTGGDTSAHESKFALTAGPDAAKHATCLAMLLQGMPAVVTQTSLPIERFISRPIAFETHSEAFKPRQILFVRGRAPPVHL